MVADKLRKIYECGQICTEVVGNSGNFHYKQARVIDMWASGYYKTFKSPQSTDQKASIPLQYYEQI